MACFCSKETLRPDICLHVPQILLTVKALLIVSLNLAHCGSCLKQILEGMLACVSFIHESAAWKMGV